MNTTDQVNPADYDMEKIKALPEYKPQEHLTSVRAIAEFASMMLDAPEAELRTAMKIIAEAKSQ